MSSLGLSFSSNTWGQQYSPSPTYCKKAKAWGQGGDRWWHYLRGSIDVQHKGVIPGDHTPAPGAALAPLVTDEL